MKDQIIKAISNRKVSHKDLQKQFRSAGQWQLNNALGSLIASGKLRVVGSGVNGNVYQDERRLNDLL